MRLIATGMTGQGRSYRCISGAGAHRCAIDQPPGMIADEGPLLQVYLRCMWSVPNDRATGYDRGQVRSYRCI